MSFLNLKSLVLSEEDKSIKATFNDSSLYTTGPLKNTLEYDTTDEFKKAVLGLFKAYCDREYHFNTTNNYKWLSVFSDIAKVLREDDDYKTLLKEENHSGDMYSCINIYTELRVFKQLSGKYVDTIYNAMVHTKQQKRGLYYVIDSRGRYYFRQGERVIRIDDKELATTKYNRANSVFTNILNFNGEQLFIKKVK